MRTLRNVAFISLAITVLFTAPRVRAESRSPDCTDLYPSFCFDYSDDSCSDNGCVDGQDGFLAACAPQYSGDPACEDDYPDFCYDMNILCTNICGSFVFSFSCGQDPGCEVECACWPCPSR